MDALLTIKKGEVMKYTRARRETGGRPAIAAAAAAAVGVHSKPASPPPPRSPRSGGCESDQDDDDDAATAAASASEPHGWDRKGGNSPGLSSLIAAGALASL